MTASTPRVVSSVPITMDSTPPLLPGHLGFPAPDPNADITSKESSSSRSSRTSYPHIRSCTVCRSRKVKCDREWPCRHCVRAGTECVYPAGPGRAPKRPRQAVDARVLDRLSYLEELLKSLENKEETGRTLASTTSPEAGNPPVPSSDNGSSQVERQFGRLVIDETRSCYVSNILLASLGDEVRIRRIY